MTRILWVLALGLVSCGKSGTEPAPAEPGGGGASGGERPEMSSAECGAAGGHVVGDIGDGAVHRPDYRCEHGAAPLGTIVADPGGPIGVEGSVCCAGPAPVAAAGGSSD